MSRFCESRFGWLIKALCTGSIFVVSVVKSVHLEVWVQEYNMFSPLLCFTLDSLMMLERELFVWEFHLRLTYDAGGRYIQFLSGSYSLYVGTSKFFYFTCQSIHSETIDSFSSLHYKFSISQVYIVYLLSFSLSHAHDCV